MRCFEKVMDEELRVLLTQKWKVSHPEAIMQTSVRQLVK